MFHRTVHLLTATMLATLAVLGFAGPSVAKVSRPPASYYGMHYNRVSEGTWPQARIGSIRLWDTGTSWRDIQPARGVWDWSRLDAAVSNARSHGASVTLVLGGTPQWAAANPDCYAWMYPAGFNSPPADRTDWWVYVHAVAQRYAGRISAYEVWNEANTELFWASSPAELARLARIARHAVRSAGSRALMLSPSVLLRDGVPHWIRAYARAGGYRAADVVAVHGYPPAGSTVQTAMRMYDRARAELRTYGVRHPLWDTETNMETNTARSGRLSARTQAAQLVAYYRGAWHHGVRRVFWYDWSATDNIGVRVAQHTGSLQPSEAGWAFTAMQG